MRDISDIMTKYLPEVPTDMKIISKPTISAEDLQKIFSTSQGEALEIGECKHLIRNVTRGLELMSPIGFTQILSNFCTSYK